MLLSETEHRAPCPGHYLSGGGGGEEEGKGGKEGGEGERERLKKRHGDGPTCRLCVLMM